MKELRETIAKAVITERYGEEVRKVHEQDILEADAAIRAFAEAMLSDEAVEAVAKAIVEAVATQKTIPEEARYILTAALDAVTEGD